MSISVAPLPWLIPFPGDGQGRAPTEEDDGIHILPVTRVEPRSCAS